MAIWNEFPARAGMNRASKGKDHEPKGVPRTRGDEPVMAKLGINATESSPHARG